MGLLDALADFGPLGIIAGVSLSINLFVFVEFVRGTWTSRKNVDAVQKIADQWQAAWEVSQSNQTRTAELLTKMTALSDVFEHFFESFKKVVTK